MNGSFGWQLIPFPDSSYSQRVDSGHRFVADRPIRRFVRHSGIPDLVPMDISRLDWVASRQPGPSGKKLLNPKSPPFRMILQ
jgi:hypothetical protein